MRIYRLITGIIYSLFISFLPSQNLSSLFKKEVTQSNLPTVFQSGDSRYVVRTSIDLGGKSLVLPPHIVIEFGNNGRLVNGELVGNNTRLKFLRASCIGVRCSGSWILPSIKDSFFDTASLSDTQILDNITNMQSDDIENVIYLDKPSYYLVLESNHKRALCLSSNTKLFNNSKLCVLGNDLTQYAVISVGKKKNILIKGGEIEGDVGKHVYYDNVNSQWGFGIQLSRSHDVSIIGTKITKCMGDGIYIGGGDGKYYGDFTEASCNIKIKNVYADDNRRQGLSITYAYNVLLEESIFTNTGRTEFVSPGCGLDIEPNENQSVARVVVRNCSFLHNDRILDVSVGGYRVKGDRCSVESVVFEDCRVTGILSVRTGSTILRNCSMGTLAIHLGEMPREKVTFEKCEIKGGNGITIRTSCTVSDDKKLPVYYFKNCSVSVEDIKTRALISTISHTGKERGELSFEECDLSMPSGGSQNYDLVQEKCVYNFSFKRCTINTQGRILSNRGYAFLSCTLDCSYINLISTRGPCIIEKCTVKASDSMRSVVLSPNHSQSEHTRYFVRGNSIIGHEEKSMITQGIDPASYVISNNVFSN